MGHSDDRPPPRQETGVRDATAQELDRRRREVLIRLGKATGYAAPVTVAMLSMKASACSMTC